jgi:hypothetical protein
MAIPAGALDSDPGLRPTKNVFWSLRAPWNGCRHGLPAHDLRPPKSKRRKT